MTTYQEQTIPGVFEFSGCLKTDPKLENNSFRVPETMNCMFWQKFRVD
jgi:hypothetical protein